MACENPQRFGADKEALSGHGQGEGLGLGRALCPGGRADHEPAVTAGDTEFKGS